MKQNFKSAGSQPTTGDVPKMNGKDNISTFRSPQRQLWNHTTLDQQKKLASLLRIVKTRYQEDLCLGLVAYIRFDIYRPFDNPAMQSLYEQCLDIVITP